MTWRAKDIIEICDGKLYAGNLETECETFSKDTRTLKKGDVYIGIKGETFDGNEFYETAFMAGAGACLIEESFTEKLKNTNQAIIIVKNAKEALRQLALAKLKDFTGKIIAVTGSVGKTTTRDMIYAVVSKKYKTLVTEGNYNNDIGLPLTILKLTDEEVLVLEMGMNHLGEIEYLSNIAKPDIAVITNVLPVHIENLGNIENILKAKLEIISGLKANGKLIINHDNENLATAKIKDAKVITCGLDYAADYQAINLGPQTFDVNIEEKNYDFINRVDTKPFILNALLALAVGRELEIPIKDMQAGLADYKLTNKRLEHHQTKTGINIINDAYNANADSMINAIEYLLKAEGGRKLAVLGNINELGTYAKALHEKVGTYIATTNLDFLITVGERAKYISDAAACGLKSEKIKHFLTKEAAQEFLKSYLKPEDTIIIKASNGEKLWELVDFIDKTC